MLSTNFVLLTAFAYVIVLFLLAFISDSMSRRGKDTLLRSPLIYTLSISVYCTSWTFYGAVGSAARNGLEFATIYLGPTLVFIGWWFLLSSDWARTPDNIDCRSYFFPIRQKYNPCCACNVYRRNRHHALYCPTIKGRYYKLRGG